MKIALMWRQIRPICVNMGLIMALGISNLRGRY